MAEKCATKECLRGVATAGTRCMPCEKLMPPMKNPKSPHAYTSSPPTTGTQKAKDKPSKEELVVNKGDKKTPSLLGTKIDKEKVKKNWKKGKTDIEINQMQKEAVKVIFTSYWYGWPDGVPPAFTELFKPYGNFISIREKPSKMKGKPDTHKSTINAKAKKSFVLVVEAIYPIEGTASAFKAIQTSPIMLEALGDVSPTDAIEMVKNNGKSFLFTKNKTDGSEYTYTDDGGTKRAIPRWAIA